MNSLKLKTFQELSLTELYSILKLRVDVFVVEQKCPYAELDNEDQDSLHLFYKANDKIIAYLRLIHSHAGNVRIGRVVTAKAFRGKGVSSQLMKDTMEYIQENYASKKIILSSQEYLQHFYTRYGFKPVSEMYLEDGIPHVDMEFDI